MTNTVERFKAFDRDGAMAAAAGALPSAIAAPRSRERHERHLSRVPRRRSAGKLVDAISSGKAAADPALLSPFLLVSFPALKQFSFLYWCVFS